MLADSHSLYDDRIYWKQALSLKKAGYEVHYLLAGEKDEKGRTTEGVFYQTFKRDTYPGNPALNYMAKRSPGGLYQRIFKEAASLCARVYHIHDLKMNRLGSKLKTLPFAPKIIYDVHEPYPENIMDYWASRKYVSSIRKFWSERIKYWERKSTSSYDLIIATEENIQKRFREYFPDKAVEIIYNYTDLPVEELTKDWEKKEFDAIYTGGITEYRGAWKILEAVRVIKKTLPGIRVLFLGNWFPEELKERMVEFIQKNQLSEQVTMKDAVPYSEIATYYKKSKVGLGIFLPIATHRIILQIKIFEYMNFGLPIVGSNFGHIQHYIQKHDCGNTVDPEDPADIARGIMELLQDRVLYIEKSRNGIEAVRENYRWEKMENKLISLYENLLNNSA